MLLLLFLLNELLPLPLLVASMAMEVVVPCSGRCSCPLAFFCLGLAGGGHPGFCTHVRGPRSSEVVVVVAPSSIADCRRAGLE
jgi:hypothetical protein